MEKVAVPCIDNLPLTVILRPNVFVPLPDNVKLLYGAPSEYRLIVWAPFPLYSIVPEPGVNVPIYKVLSTPPTFRVPPSAILRLPLRLVEIPNVALPETVRTASVLKASVAVVLLLPPPTCKEAHWASVTLTVTE